jgi:hypothetical protein
MNTAQIMSPPDISDTIQHRSLDRKSNALHVAGFDWLDCKLEQRSTPWAVL